MVKGDKVRLNHELLIWRGFTLTNGVWSYPDGGTVDNGVPYFPEDETACCKWLLPKLGYCELKYSNKKLYSSAKVQLRLDSEPYYGQDKTLALALCLAIQELIRSK